MSHLAGNRHHDLSGERHGSSTPNKSTNGRGTSLREQLYDRTMDAITLTEVYSTPMESVKICYLGTGRHCDPLQVKGYQNQVSRQARVARGPHERREITAFRKLSNVKARPDSYPLSSVNFHKGVQTGVNLFHQAEHAFGNRHR
jgi:hypothetical protein